MSKNNTICWADIPVVDLDRAIRFYSAVLGKDVVKQSGPGFEFGLLPHSDDNVAGCLAKMEDNKPSETGPLVYLSVDGRLDAAITAARDNGGRIMKERHPIGPHGHRAVILDTEGNRIALHSTT
ncbi:VOC family protein [Zavarzinella formosa]|uniref:VOC family protein n=1 Tax=Zavarzinella formosa TaxID=360055 RepID=UPI0002DC0C6F|nr:VOC family protein [Zavarzinella formosa]